MTERFAATVRQCHAFLAKQIEEGRGDDLMTLDPRGLDTLRPHNYRSIFITLPEPGHANSNGRVFLRAVF